MILSGHQSYFYARSFPKGRWKYNTKYRHAIIIRYKGKNLSVLVKYFL